MTISWKDTDDYILGVTQGYNLSNTKVACFDFDDTLVKYIKKFSDEWSLYDDNIVSRLQNYIENNYRIVILSNQKGISMGKTDSENWKKKIEKFSDLVNLPFMIVAATQDNEYRKPLTKMWSLVNGDKDVSFFCGDAGGLPKRTINKTIIDKDFSDTDLKFALNVGIRFMHRDEFIYGVKQECIPKYPKLDNNNNNINIILEDKTVVINVGYPGSGKSSYVNTRYSYATIINQDTLKTKAKCMNLYKTSLKNNNNLIIIDNTNPSVDIRKEYIELAKLYKYKVVCFNFTTSKELSKHNNYYRAFITGAKVVPTIAYNIYGKKFVSPTLDEGFDKVYNIDFCNTTSDKLYYMFYF